MGTPWDYRKKFWRIVDTNNLTSTWDIGPLRAKFRAMAQTGPQGHALIYKRGTVVLCCFGSDFQRHSTSKKSSTPRTNFPMVSPCSPEAIYPSSLERLSRPGQPVHAMNSDFLPADFDHGPKPVVLIDSREQQMLRFERLTSRVCTLVTADYSVAGCERDFGIERKSITDLVQCCCKERRRFEAELARLRAFRFKRLLIVGDENQISTGQYRSHLTPRSVFASLNAWQMRFDLPFVFSPTPKSAAQLVEVFAVWFWRERVSELREMTKYGTISGDAISQANPAGTPANPLEERA